MKLNLCNATTERRSTNGASSISRQKIYECLLPNSWRRYCVTMWSTILLYFRSENCDTPAESCESFEGKLSIELRGATDASVTTTGSSTWKPDSATPTPPPPPSLTPDTCFHFHGKRRSASKRDGRKSHPKHLQRAR